MSEPTLIHAGTAALTLSQQPTELELGTVVADGAPFALPLNAGTQKLAFLARSGAGESYAAGKLTEQLWAAHIPFVVLDPVGIWYGLRLAADGVGPGLPIPVFGGEFGDILLEPGAGELVADLVVDRGISLVLDVSSFRKGDRKRFATAFAEQLFHRKKTARSPLLLILEEAQAFVPQRASAGEERMLGAYEDIAKIGRNYGLGLALISQRPQSVHKDVLNQVEALFVLQLNAAQERKAIRDWIDAQGIDAGATVEELPQLPIGTAVVWSPQWLRFFGKVQIGAKTTYNASATPDFATAPVAPQPLEAADLAALRAAMQGVVEQAAQRDPAALRRRVAELERQLRERDQQIADLQQAGVSAAAAPVPAADTALASQLAQLEQRLDLRLGRLEQLLEHSAGRAAAPARSGKGAGAGTPAAKATKPAAASKPAAPAPARRARPRRAAATAPELPKPQQAILNALADFEAAGLRSVDHRLVAVWAGQSPRSSALGNHLSALRSAGLLAYPQAGELGLTDAGRARATAGRPLSRAGLHQAWLERLPKAQAAILRVLLECYPQALDREALARQAGQSSRSSAYGDHLSTLREAGVVSYPQAGRVAATALLFPSGVV